MISRCSLFMLFVVTIVGLSGCVSKPPIIKDGKQVGIMFYNDRGLKEGIEKDTREERNEIAPFMDANLLHQLKNEGYNAIQIQSKNQYSQNSFDYLLLITIVDHRFVSGAVRFFAGAAAGPDMLKCNYCFGSA